MASDIAAFARLRFTAGRPARASAPLFRQLQLLNVSTAHFSIVPVGLGAKVESVGWLVDKTCSPLGEELTRNARAVVGKETRAGANLYLPGISGGAEPLGNGGKIGAGVLGDDGERVAEGDPNSLHARSAPCRVAIHVARNFREPFGNVPNALKMRKRLLRHTQHARVALGRFFILYLIALSYDFDGAQGRN
jgi:hypothetical protein